MANEIHVGDIGTQLLITILDDGLPVDVSDAIVLRITIKRPDGTLIIASGSLHTNGEDGVIYYTIVLGDLNQSDVYKIQAYVELIDGSYYSNIGSFSVKCNL